MLNPISVNQTFMSEIKGYDDIPGPKSNPCGDESLVESHHSFSLDGLKENKNDE